MIFYSGGVGFYVALDSVVEVQVGIGVALDMSRRDADCSIVAALRFRGTWLPAVDPTGRFELIPEVEIEKRTALVLKGEEGNWAVLVDRVGSIVSGKDLVSCAVPEPLRRPALDCYSELALLDGRPCVGFDLERFYGSVPASA